MAKKIFFDKNYLIIFLFILIIFISICIIYYIQNKCNKCDNTLYDKDVRYNNEINNKIQNIENNLKEANNKIESYQNNKENIVNSVVYPSAVINRDPKELNALMFSEGTTQLKYLEESLESLLKLLNVYNVVILPFITFIQEIVNDCLQYNH